MTETTDGPKATIAILGGTGKEGPGLAMRWAAAGYPIIIGSRQLEKAQVTAGEINEALGIGTVTGLENTAAARAEGRKVIVLLPAHDVVCCLANVPATSPRPMSRARRTGSQSFANNRLRPSVTVASVTLSNRRQRS